MKKNFLRILIAVAVLAAMCMMFTACLLPMGEQPSKTADDSAATVPYAERKLVFRRNVQAVQVNMETVLGYFCYEDNQLLVLTPDSKTEKADNSVSFTLKMYDTEAGAEPVEAPADAYSYEIRDNGYLYINSSVIGYAEIEAHCANGSNFGPEKFTIAGRGISLWDIIILGIGIYLLVSAIIGKGKLFENEFIIAGKEKQHKTIVRIASLVVSILMIASAALAAFDKYGKLSTLKLIILGVMLAVFIAAMLMLRKCVDQKAKREAQEAKYTGGPGKAPSAAFEFDENEPTVDDINNGGGEQ